MYSHRALRILKRLPGGRSRFADEPGAQKKTEGSGSAGTLRPSKKLTV